MAGQTLEFVIKVPENLMPISKNRRCALIPVEAAYSDDEQETAVAQENRQVWFFVLTSRKMHATL